MYIMFSFVLAHYLHCILRQLCLWIFLEWFILGYFLYEKEGYIFFFKYFYIYFYFKSICHRVIEEDRVQFNVHIYIILWEIENLFWLYIQRLLIQFSFGDR